MQANFLKSKTAVTAAILVLGLLAAILILLTVLELFSSPAATVLEIRQPITASSSSLTPYNSTVQRYRTQVSGEVINRGDETLQFDRIEAVISDGTREKTVVLAEAVQIPPRVSRELFLEFEDEWDYDRVLAVRQVTGETAELLSGDEAEKSTGGLLLYGALLVIDALVLIHVCKQRYYLWQETKQKSL